MQVKCEKSFGSDSAGLTKLTSCIAGFNDVHNDFIDVGVDCSSGEGDGKRWCGGESCSCGRVTGRGGVVGMAG